MKTRILLTLALATLAFSGICIAQDTPRVGIVPSDDGLFPFVISYEMAKGATDFSALLDAPAGKHGFTRIEGQHFVNDAGRIRFNGVNIVGGACFPTHEQAERLAQKRFDIVVFRAFRPLDKKMIKVLMRIIKPEGYLCAYKAKKEKITEEMDGIKEFIPGYEVVPLQVPFLTDNNEYERNLVVVKKPVDL